MSVPPESVPGIGGTVITDPGVVNGGSVNTGAAAPLDAHSGIDLPNITFGAKTTLAYSENSFVAWNGFGMTDGRHAATIALLGNYMAGSFATTAGGGGGTLISGTPQPEQQSLLTHPPHG